MESGRGVEAALLILQCLFVRRPPMKPNAIPAERTGPAEPTAPNTLSRNMEPTRPTEFMDLTAEQIRARASTTTQVLSEILEREDNTYYVHHWGINE